ncbi:hypothetical protein K4G90_23695, partial [Mycobacterium tuberculosis]|nr:hypothetical protein [Mycobacterium tuberculosis]
KASRVDLFLSKDKRLNRRDRRLAKRSLAALKPGGTKTIRFRHGFGRDVSGRFLIARLDATDRVEELDEKNNVVVSKRLRPMR